MVVVKTRRTEVFRRVRRRSVFGFVSFGFVSFVFDRIVYCCVVRGSLWFLWFVFEYTHIVVIEDPPHRSSTGRPPSRSVQFCLFPSTLSTVPLNVLHVFFSYAPRCITQISRKERTAAALARHPIDLHITPTPTNTQKK